MPFNIASAIFTGIFILLLGGLAYLHRQGKSFSLRVGVALISGVALGFAVQRFGNEDNQQLLTQLFNLVGLVYLKLLQMIVIPIVLTAIINSIINLRQGNTDSLRQLTVRSVGLLLGLTGLSAAIGLLVGAWLNVGAGMQLPAEGMQPEHMSQGIVATLLAFIPANPIATLVNNNTIGLAILAILIGVAAFQLHHKDSNAAESFIHFIKSSFEVIKQLTRIIIALTPYGVLALIANLCATQGGAALSAMLHFIFAMYLAMAIVWILHATLLVLSGYNLGQYYKNAYRPLLLAFTTRSSLGTLPVTIETLIENFKIRPGIASFVPSLGATIGMNACAGVYPAMLVAMTMHIQGQSIGIGLVLLIMLVNAIASLGVSGIPGTAFVAAGVSLMTLGLPYAIVGLVQGVDPIIDMGRTATNVNGVLTTALVVDKTIHD